MQCVGFIGKLIGLESSDEVSGDGSVLWVPCCWQGLASSQTAPPPCSALVSSNLYPCFLPGLSAMEKHKQGGGAILGSLRGKGCVSQSHREVGSHRRQKGQHRTLLQQDNGHTRRSLPFSFCLPLEARASKALS